MADRLGADTDPPLDRADLRRLLDKQAIQELLTRYLRAVDRGDVSGVRSCYLPGATEDHGGLFDGPATSYVDSIQAVLEHPRSLTAHYLTNVLVEVSGDHAVAESYVATFTRVQVPDGWGDSVVGARLLDRLERGADGWGIRHRQLLWEWGHDAPTAEGWLFGLLTDRPDALHRGGKFPDDPVYRSRP